MNKTTRSWDDGRILIGGVLVGLTLLTVLALAKLAPTLHTHWSRNVGFAAVAVAFACGLAWMWRELVRSARAADREAGTPAGR
jgi:hypothetical protein